VALKLHLDIGFGMKSGLILVLLICLAVAGCSSLDSDTATNSAAKTAVPGEVNPDAPDAAQNLRTSPGRNF
jgi:hypothetical protein